MVESVTSYSGNGVRDWLIQRVSAIILAVYALFLLGFFLFNPYMDYVTWGGLFAHTSMKIFSLLALLALIGHAWIGVWTVLTDYVKPYPLRIIIQVLVIVALLTYLIWGVDILWSI